MLRLFVRDSSCYVTEQVLEMFFWILNAVSRKQKKIIHVYIHINCCLRFRLKSEGTEKKIIPYKIGNYFFLLLILVKILGFGFQTDQEKVVMCNSV